MTISTRAHRTATPLVEEACCEPLVVGVPAEDEAERLALAFRALGEPARIRLLAMIASREEGEACVCELVEPIGRSQPTVSHHLSTLVEAGLVTRDKRGRWAYYRAVPERLEALRAVLGPAS